MIDEGLRKAVTTLTWEELRRSSKIHPPFVDMHQGYGVIKEEIEECDEAMTIIKAHLDGLWRCTRVDDLGVFKGVAIAIKKCAIELALEAIQVAAVAEKLINVYSAEEKQQE